MELWEYQVIHLNVEAPAPPPPSSAPEAPAAGPGAPVRAETVFSKEYLEKEFPGFYGGQRPAGAPAQEHPANQLRGFLNLQGREGWQLVGFYPVGQLQMMIFRRPLVVASSPEVSAAGGPPPASPPPAPIAKHRATTERATTDATATDPTAMDPTAMDPTAADRAGMDPTGTAPLLEPILERLAALERRLPPALADEPQALPFVLADLQDGAILEAQHRRELEGHPRLGTPEAARALGFRSAASLLNLAARSGYRPGLIKRGVHSALAVYVGSEKSGRGGRDRRLWVVLTIPDG